jgi:hypothetical protein
MTDSARQLLDVVDRVAERHPGLCEVEDLRRGSPARFAALLEAHRGNPPVSARARSMFSRIARRGSRVPT